MDVEYYLTTIFKSAVCNVSDHLATADSLQGEFHSMNKFVLFSASYNIYISCLSYDVNVRRSVRLSVMFVHCGHRVHWIPDIFACLDRWMSLLLTDNASPGSSDGMMPGFLVEEGRGHLTLC